MWHEPNTPGTTTALSASTRWLISCADATETVDPAASPAPVPTSASGKDRELSRPSSSFPIATASEETCFSSLVVVPKARIPPIPKHPRQPPPSRHYRSALTPASVFILDPVGAAGVYTKKPCPAARTAIFGGNGVLISEPQVSLDPGPQSTVYSLTRTGISLEIRKRASQASQRLEREGPAHLFLSSPPNKYYRYRVILSVFFSRAPRAFSTFYCNFDISGTKGRFVPKPSSDNAFTV